MVVFPNAKINLGLNIISRRPDNYHNIETIFYPISLRDALEVLPTEGTDIQLHNSGFRIDGNTQNNLVIKAYHLLKNKYNLPPVEIFLHKAIPFGAGLGGGSADASFMLLLLRDLFKLEITETDLLHYAALLGADCPFFIHNRAMLARGIGNEFQEINVSLTGYRIVLVKPDIIVPTAEAYSAVKPQKPTLPLEDIIQMPISCWREYMHNDFEDSVFIKYPEIKDIKEKLYRNGAIYAAMSGSGSSVFGIYNSNENIDNLFPGCFLWQGACE